MKGKIQVVALGLMCILGIALMAGAPNQNNTPATGIWGAEYHWNGTQWVPNTGDPGAGTVTLSGPITAYLFDSSGHPVTFVSGSVPVTDATNAAWWSQNGTILGYNLTGTFTPTSTFTPTPTGSNTPTATFTPTGSPAIVNQGNITYPLATTSATPQLYATAIPSATVTYHKYEVRKLNNYGTAGGGFALWLGTVKYPLSCLAPGGGYVDMIAVCGPGLPVSISGNDFTVNTSAGASITGTLIDIQSPFPFQNLSP